MEEVKLLVQDKYKTKEEDLIEIKIWKVPKSKEFPDVKNIQKELYGGKHGNKN